MSTEKKPLKKGPVVSIKGQPAFDETPTKDFKVPAALSGKPCEVCGNTTNMAICPVDGNAMR